MQNEQHIKNPYPGIRSFKFNESHLFFGREKQIDDLFAILHRNNFIAITGASGSGKSSLVKAGLLPQLNQATDDWIYQSFRPGTEPLKMLAEAIYKILFSAFPEDNSDLSKTAIYKNLSENPDAFVKNLFSKFPTKKILLYIDQFEEIFHDKTNRTAEKAEESDKFIKALITIISQENGKLYTVISLRTDFLGDCSKYPQLANRINQGHYLIPEMTSEEKERAIREPARYAGADISEELIAVLKADILQNGTHLPVLQHALMRTWDYRSGKGELRGNVELDHYTIIGTVSNALSVHAEEIFSGIETERGRFIAEKVFKTLAHIGKENRLTRRPTTLGELSKIAECEQAELIEIIELFRADKNSFLVPAPPVRLASDTIIDISHESIMRVWKRMQEWIDQENKSAQMYLRISRSAALYQEGKTALLTNPDLDLALKWKKDNNPNETWALRYEPAFDRAMSYLEHSKLEFDRAIKLKVEKEKREIKRTRSVAVMMAAATLISLLFMAISLNMMFKAESSEKDAKDKQKLAQIEKDIADGQTKEAVSSKRISEQQKEIANQQRILAEEQKIFAVRKQREALEQKEIADIAKDDAIDARDIARGLKAEAIKLRDQAVADREYAVSQQKRAEFSEAQTDTMLRLAIAKTLAIQAVKEHQNNLKTQNISDYKQELPAIFALQAYYFNKQFGKNKNNPEIVSALLEVSDSKSILNSEDGHKDAIRTIYTSEDGKISLSGDESGTIFMFENSNFSKPINLKKTNTGNAGIRSLSMNPDDKTIFAGNTKGQILVWAKDQIQTAPKIIKNGSSIVTALYFDAVSKKLISADANGSLKIWTIGQDDYTSTTIVDSKSRINSICSNHKLLYAGLENGKILIFDKTEGYRQVSEIETGEKITALACRDDLLIAAYASGRFELFDNGKSSIKILAHNAGINDVVFIDTQKIACCSYDRTVKIWDIRNLSEPPVMLADHTDWVYAISVVDKGKKIVSGSADKSLRVTTIDSEMIKTGLRKKVSGNMSKSDWIKYVGKDIDYQNTLPTD